MAHTNVRPFESLRPVTSSVVNIQVEYDILRAEFAELKLELDQLKLNFKELERQNRHLKSQVETERSAYEQLRILREGEESLLDKIQHLFSSEAVDLDSGEDQPDGDNTLEQILELVLKQNMEINVCQPKVVEQTRRIKMLADRVVEHEERISAGASFTVPRDVIPTKQPIQCTEDLLPRASVKQSKVVLLSGYREVESSDLEKPKLVKANNFTTTSLLTVNQRPRRGSDDIIVDGYGDTEHRLLRGGDSEVLRGVVPDNMPGQRVTGLSRSALETMLNSVMACPFCQREFDLSNEDEKDDFYIHVDNHIDK